MLHSTRFAFVVAALAAGGVWAQTADYPPPPPPDYTAPDYRDAPNLVSSVGMSAEIGGGVVRFIDRDISDITNAGGSWMARLAVGTRRHFGGELAYVGTAQNLNTLGVEDRAILLSNGVEAVLRVNALTGVWQPYAIAGYTYRRYTLQNTSFNTSAVANSEDVSEIPVGVGLAWRYRGFIADARFTLHGALAGNQLLPETNLSMFGINAKVGFEF